MRLKLGVLKRLIREAAGGEDLALVVIGDDEEDFLGLGSILGGSKLAVLYDASEARDAVSTGGKEDLVPALRKSLRGMIEIGKPIDPCLGAWEVQRAAGEGYGRYLYTIAGALSPKHLLVPDRGSVSSKAKAAWKSQKNRKRYELDDIKVKRTDTPYDDCRFHAEDYLNYAYEYGDEGESYVSAFGRAHEDFVSELETSGADASDITSSFKMLASEKFLKNAADIISSN